MRINATHENDMTFQIYEIFLLTFIIAFVIFVEVGFKETLHFFSPFAAIHKVKTHWLFISLLNKEIGYAKPLF